MTHLHGPVPVDDDFYSERPFETELARNIQSGRWVLMLGPRQHGKTSALIRLKIQLAEVGMHVASVDLQSVPPVSSYNELVAWFANRVASELDIAPSIEPTNDIMEALSVAVPSGKAPIILLVDEASNIANDEWRNSFYGQLRAIASASGEADDDHIAKRVRFVFSGTFRVEQLVAEANSPFNTCEHVETTDLELDDLLALALKANIHATDADAVAREIFAQVGGQPYLVQRLFDTFDGTGNWVVNLSGAVDKLRLGNTDHIRHLFGRVLADEALVEIVRKVIQNGSVPFAPGDHDQSYLMVLGLLKLNGNGLQFRNALYEHIATSSPNFATIQQNAEEVHAVFFTYPVEKFALIANVRLREIAYSAQLGAVGAYRNGGNRLALAGYGNALEAVLLNYLLQQTEAKIIIANAACAGGGGFHEATNPATWSLVNMMRGARAVAGQNAVEIPENLRKWRNLVHPSVCLQDYMLDEDYAPEVATAAGLFGIVLRDLA
jgi:hypothetical protein